MNIRSLTLILCTLLQTAIKAQENKAGADSLYIKTFKEKFHITSGIQTNNAEFILTYPDNTRYIISPDQAYQQFIILQYQLLRFKYSITPAYLNPNKTAEKGENKRTEIGLSFSIANFDIDLSRQSAKGYYIKNTKDFLPGWQPGNPYLQLPELRSTIYALEITYNTNKNFSLAGITTGNEAQLKTAYAFLPALTVYDIGFNLDRPLTPNTYANDGNLDINLKIPFAASFVISKKWYATAISGPIVGVNFYHSNFYNASLEKTTTRSTNALFGYIIHSGIGYNGEKWYWGMDVFTERYTAKVDNERNTRFFYGGSVYAGIRLKPTVFMQKANRWLGGIFSGKKN